VVADEEVLDEETRTSLLGHLSSGAGRWRAQQLLKLSVPEVTTAEAIVVIDADTILVRPRRFRDGDRTLLLASREFNIPYYEAAARLWQEPMTLPAFSCVAHQMCFVRTEVVALRDEIEARWNMDWRSAIVQASGERKGFAESELYGQWRLRTHPELCVVRGFHNVSLRRSEIRSVVELERQVGRGVYSVSCHYWL